MFDSIQRGLSDAFKKLRGRGRLTADNIREGLRAVRQALLEADVNFDVVNNFIANVESRAVGQDVLAKVDPSEQIVKIVYDELVGLMQVKEEFRIPAAKEGKPTVVMLCGLQGSGKTTTCGKLALNFRELGRRPLLVAADLQRPAAVEQLKVIGQQLTVPVYSEASTPVEVCRNALAHARTNGHDLVILDTAGRLQIDADLMTELAQIEKLVRPDLVFLVVDAMIGQEAANVAKAFHDKLVLNGVILTKMDGDARGGAALSIKEVTGGVPIRFIGVGEKLDKLDLFNPKGIASRILGQGDMMGLVGKVADIQKSLSEEEMKAQQKKIEDGKFTLDDFRKQFQQLQKMGMKNMVQMMPGMSEMVPEGEDPEEALKRVQGMIDSMTKKERNDPDIIDLNRRRRIAAGSGTQPHEVKQFIGQFEQVRTLMTQMARMSIWERIKMVTGLGKAGAFMPGGESMLKTKGDTGHRKTPKERAEERKQKKKDEKKKKK